MLERYAELKQRQATIAAELAEIETALAERAKSGPVAAGGWIAHWKPGRKSTNHEAAAKAEFEEYNRYELHTLSDALRGIQEKHSTTKTTVAWAKVTAEAKIDVVPFTVEGAPVFVVEEVK
jgi:hypothetical protein